jgi:hypothetical protein
LSRQLAEQAGRAESGSITDSSSSPKTQLDA